MVRLIDVVRDALRVRKYALKTERTYLHWIRRYARYCLPSHPREVGADGVKKYLTHLAVDLQVSWSTQNQALSALLFLYGLFGIELGNLDMVRARRSVSLPTVLTHDEAMRTLENLRGVYKIMGELMYW